MLSSPRFSSFFWGGVGLLAHLFFLEALPMASRSEVK
jgi:hypothetical protein